MSTKSFYGTGQGSFYGGGMYGNGQPPIMAIEKELGPASIVSFNDGLKNKPLKKCVVDIEPVQDLHGYDSPWPAGGGKNLIDPTGIENLKYIQSTGYIENTTGWSVSGYIPVTAGVTYVLNTVNSGTAAYHAFYDSNKEFVSSIISTTTPVTIPEGISFIRLSMKTLTNDPATTAQFEKGSVSSAWSPYSNICPITGWTGTKVTRCGKNLIPNNYAFTSGTTLYGVTATANNDGSIHVVSAGTGSSTAFFNLNVQRNPNIILPAGTYRVSGGQSGKVGISVKNAASNVNLISPFTLTEPTGLFVYLACTSSAAFDVVIYPQLEVGSVATDFEPYTKEVFDITFPNEAGTVYGGTLDVIKGTLTVDRATLDLGTLTWVYNTTLISAAPLMNSVDIVQRKPGSMSLMCSEYALFPGNRGQMPDKTVTSYNDSNATPILIRDDSFSDAASFKTAMSGVQLVYELAEPVVYNLTPQQITTLLGTNTIWADIGDITIKYLAKK